MRTRRLFWMAGLGWFLAFPSPAANTRAVAWLIGLQ
jgi:hypothetical protein